MTKIVRPAYIVSMIFLQSLCSTSSQSLTHHKKKIINKCPIGFEWNDEEQGCEHKFKQFCENIISERDQDDVSIETFNAISMQFLYEWQFRLRIIDCKKITNDLLSANSLDIFAKNIQDLSILNGLSNLTILTLNGLTKLKDLDFLYYLSNIRSLNISKVNGDMDYSPIGKSRNSYIGLAIVGTNNIRNFDFLDEIDSIKFLNLSETNFDDARKLIGKRTEVIRLVNTPIKSIDDFIGDPYLKKVILSGKVYSFD